MNYNGRLKRLENTVGEPGEPLSWADFAVEVLEAIASGLIVDYADFPENDLIDYSGLLSPTCAPNLDDTDRAYAYGLLQQAEQLVREIAMQTGWRSGGRTDWHGYRANSVAELRFLMGRIYDAS